MSHSEIQRQMNHFILSLKLRTNTKHIYGIEWGFYNVFQLTDLEDSVIGNGV